MFWLAQAILIGWLPLVLMLFLFMPPRRAVVTVVIGSWLFLPQLGFTLKLIPDYDKMSATCYAIILGALLLDPKNRVLNFKWSWIDIPMITWCLAPSLASMTNGLGSYDMFSVFTYRMVSYGLPWLIGRLYFQTPDDVRDFAVGIVIGGMVYVPLCLYEVRMSPNLHETLYGFKPFSDWQQVKRWGGFRPTVFMRHGLAVATWMGSAAVLAFWLWRTRAHNSIFSVPMSVCFVALVVTTFLCKSTGAFLLMAGVIGLMMTTRYLGTKWILMAVIVAVPIFLGLRSSGLVQGDGMVLFAKTAINEGRSLSLQFRLDHENAVTGYVAENNKWAFGWGGWRRAFDVRVPGYNSRAVPDSFWIHTFGETGYFGLISLYAILLIPPGLLLWKMRLKEWNDPRYAPVSGLAMSTLVFTLDSLFNAMPNPVYVVVLGGLGGMAVALTRSKSAPRTRPKALVTPPETSKTRPENESDSGDVIVLPPEAGGLGLSSRGPLGEGAG